MTTSEIWLEVTTNRRSYCVRGHGIVTWAPAERVVSIDVVTTGTDAHAPAPAADRYRGTLERALELDAADAHGAES
jgi:hypothetical protein